MITQLSNFCDVVIFAAAQVGLAVVNGQLMAIGGFDGTTYLKTVEIYDAESNSWKLYGGMNYRRLGGGVGVVRLVQQDAHLLAAVAAAASVGGMGVGAMGGGHEHMLVEMKQPLR